MYNLWNALKEYNLKPLNGKVKGNISLLYTRSFLFFSIIILIFKRGFSVLFKTEPFFLLVFQFLVFWKMKAINTIFLFIDQPRGSFTLEHIPNQMSAYIYVKPAKMQYNPIIRSRLFATPPKTVIRVIL